MNDKSREALERMPNRKAPIFSTRLMMIGILSVLSACSTAHVQDPKHTWMPATDGGVRLYNKTFSRHVKSPEELKPGEKNSVGDFFGAFLFMWPGSILDIASAPFHVVGHMFAHDSASPAVPEKTGPSPYDKTSAAMNTNTDEIADKDVDKPPKTNAKLNPEAYAVVIGIEKYRGVPSVDYAAHDAESVRMYLIQAMGFDEKNVVLLQNERATKTDLEKYLGTWLKNRVTPSSRVFVYFAGHGAPDPATGAGFLMPYEGDPNYTTDTAYSLQSLYENLAKLPAKDITVVLDACFSGAGGRSLIAKGTRPLISTLAPTNIGRNTLAMSAAAGNQISTSYPNGKHGLMTYFMLRGLQGEADINRDGRITAAELFSYMKPNVERVARLQNVEQTPTISPALDPHNQRTDAVWVQKE